MDPAHLASRSYWLGMDAPEPSPPLDRALTVDFAAIGGGFTALWTAYLLLKENPGARVAVIEKEAVGYGASGRNGGFAMTLVHRTLAHLARHAGDSGAKRVHHAAARSVDHINQTVRAEGIDCDLESTGLLTLSNTPPQDRVVRDEYETAQRLGIEDMEFLDAAAAQALIHSPRIRMAVRERACSLVNPARLARGLKRTVERMGAMVFEGTRVMDWRETAEGVEIAAEGSEGRVFKVKADRALLAPNAYATAWSATRPRMVPFYTYIRLTRPLTPDEWEAVGWKGREGAEDRRMFLHYFRPTADGRILWGGRDAVFQPGGPDARFDRDAAVFARMRATFEWFFPQLKHIPFEHEWGGPIGITGDFMPNIGWSNPARRRAAFAYGYNGHGVAITNLAAHAIRDLFAGRESDWTDLPFVGRRPAHLGPRLIRDPLVKWTCRAQMKADDEEREIKDPLVLRILNKVTGADIRIT